ncbi:MAG TPA: RND transporter [Pseudonocardia sp.]|nr:RND transporter [Pseudonocardia sp.]
MRPRRSSADGARGLSCPSRWPRPGRAAVATVLVAVLVTMLAAVGLVRLRTDTSAESFLPAGDRTLQTMDDAARSFGGDPVVVLLESAQPRELLGPDTLSRLLGLEGRLSQLPDVATVYGPATVLNQIAKAAKDLMATLSGRRDGVRIEAEQRAITEGRPQASKAEGDAAVAEFDERYASLLVQALPAGLPTLRNPGFVNTVIFGGEQEPQPQWAFVVPSPESVAILIRPRENLDQAGTERLVESVRSAVGQSGLKPQRTTVSGAPAVAAALGAQVRQEILLLGGLAIALIVLCYQLVPWHGRRRHRLLPVLATLCATGLVLAGFGWLGRPVSLGVVAFLPILIGIGSDFPAYLMQRVRRRRIIVASLASAAGFGSLAISPLPFVRDLGLALAAGVLLAVSVALVLRRFVIREPDEEPEPPARPTVRAPLVQRVVAIVVLAAIAAAGWAALSQLRVEARPEQLAEGLPAVNDIEHAERVIATSGEVQVMLSGPNVLTPEALDWMRRAEQAVVLRQGDALRPIVSLPDLLRFLGPSPGQEQIDAALNLLPDYLIGAVVRPDGQRSLLSLGLKLQDLDQQRTLVDELRAELPAPPPGYSVEVGGLPVAAVRAYTLVSSDSYLTNLIGIVAAGLVLLVGLGRRSDAVRAIVAALLATGWGLAGTWLLAVSLTPLTVALGSLTTVTACEFTVLLTDRYRRDSARLGRTVAVAALAAALGYLALTASGLAVIREFGLLLAATVGLSFLAAHAVVRLLPAREPARPDEPAPAAAADSDAREVAV